MSTGEAFSCPVGGYLDNGPGAAGPGSRTVNCASSGDCMTKMKDCGIKGSIKHCKVEKLPWQYLTLSFCLFA